MLYFAHGVESPTTPKVSNETLTVLLVAGTILFVALVIGILIAQKRAKVSSKARNPQNQSNG
jgi:hypothetical protein